jgi:glycosyltransferase involved in cell wall biosynthesis
MTFLENLLPVDSLPSNKKVQLICFSHLRWKFVWQRPQHLLTQASKHYSVIFVEEPHYIPHCQAHMEIEESSENVTIATPILPTGLTPSEAIIMQRVLLNMLVISSEAIPRIGWYYTPMAVPFSTQIPFEAIVYDCMDELSAFKGAPPNIGKLEHELLQKADIVFTGGHSLYESKRRLHNNIYPFPSSIDVSHFGKSRNGALTDPDDQRDIPKPRIGYFGVIDERLDTELLKKLAEARPDLHFVMIGPVVKVDPTSLPKADNIHWLGQKQYAELPNYLAHWDVGFMPFALNESTKYISPTKTPEFLAAGLPVVSTPIRDVVRQWGHQGLVEIAHGGPDVASKIDAALKSRGNQLWQQRVDQRLKAMSWTTTFAEMNSHIGKVLKPGKMKVIEGEATQFSPLVAARHV